MAESYKSELEGKGKVELVHISRDSGEAGMEEFYGIADPTFPAVKFSRVESLEVAMKHKANFVPCYVMVDANGDLVAEGKEACLLKAAQLLK